jgi:hypothetical protein
MTSKDDFAIQELIVTQKALASLSQFKAAMDYIFHQTVTAFEPRARYRAKGQTRYRQNRNGRLISMDRDKRR